MENKCPFCQNRRDIIFENEHAFVIRDAFPVTRGHLLVVTRRHVRLYTDTTTEERTALFILVDRAIEHLKDLYRPDGFNIGINIGKYAGQSVPHVHFHVIPRYRGDMPDPKGGVRGVIPDRQHY